MHQGILQMKMGIKEVSSHTYWPYLGCFNELEWLNTMWRRPMA